MIDFKSVINKLFYEPIGQMIVSAIFGLALSFMFVRVCKGDCTNYFAPNVNDIQDKIFKIEDTCYTYTPKACKCNDKPLENYNNKTKPENLMKE
jgi:hypothetical protein